MLCNWIQVVPLISIREALILSFFFFFNTQNSKLGQTSWNTALNYSHNLGKSLQSPMLQSPYLPKEENDGNHLRNYLIQLL